MKRLPDVATREKVIIVLKEGTREMLEEYSAPETKCYVDVESALARLRGNKVLYKKMLQLFLQSKEFEQLEEAMDAQDYAKASEVAHGIKGVAGNLSLTFLFDLSSTLMQQLRDGVCDQDLYRQYRDALAHTCSLVEEIIKKPE